MPYAKIRTHPFAAHSHHRFAQRSQRINGKKSLDRRDIYYYYKHKDQFWFGTQDFMVCRGSFAKTIALRVRKRARDWETKIVFGNTRRVVIGCKHFEHGKTHPFDYTMVTTTIAPMFACIFFFIFHLVFSSLSRSLLACVCCFFFLCLSFFGSSFAYLIRLEIESAASAWWCRSWNVARASRTHAFYDVCQTQSKGWNFPMKMRCRSLSVAPAVAVTSDSEYAYRHDDDHTYAYASTLK